MLIATIFSYSKAPPPPLIPWKSYVISSAPSIVTSTSSTSSSSTTFKPNSTASFVVTLEVDTQVRDRFSSFTRFARASTMYVAVEPVPNPTIVLSSIYVAAFSPTNFF